LTPSDKINLKGLILSNVISYVGGNFLNENIIEFLWNHQLFSYDLKEIYDSACPKNSKSARCQFALKEIYEAVEGINPYNIYKPCYTSDSVPSMTSSSVTVKRLLAGDSGRGNTPHCMDTAVKRYVNQPEVKKALRVEVDVTWNICNEINYDFAQEGSLDIIRQLLDSKIRVLALFGDLDASANFNQGSKWAEMLQLKEEEGWRQWRVDDQVAGFVTKYEKNYYFATVRGAGESIYDKPREVKELVDRFIRDERI
jgi:carboxypeptidase C (cathepsin A)